MSSIKKQYKMICGNCGQITSYTRRLGEKANIPKICDDCKDKYTVNPYIKGAIPDCILERKIKIEKLFSKKVMN